MASKWRSLTNSAAIRERIAAKNADVRGLVDGHGYAQPTEGAKGKISGENLPRPSDTDVRETRRKFRRVPALRVCDPYGSATHRGPSGGIGPYDD
jgi:hypothetical protein